jgi:hypothetical protein
MKHYVPVLFVILLYALGCGEKEAGITPEQLRNMEYKSAFAPGQRIVLSDGVYRESIVPGLEMELIVLMDHHMAYGDLDGDRKDDAAVVLIYQAGRTGTFFTLEAVVNDQGTPRHAATATLGNRIKVRGLAIDGGEVIADLTVHGPDDEECCPRLAVTNRYRLVEGRLVPVMEPSHGDARD